MKIAFGDHRKAKYSPSPVFNALAEYYISSDYYEVRSLREEDPLAFKQKVKEHLIRYINESIDAYVTELPFLKINLPENSDMQGEHVLRFDKNLQRFLDERKVLKVIVHNTKASSYLVPLIPHKPTRNGFAEYAPTGFEINLRWGLMQRMLTSFGHELGHTYFYDGSSSSLRCMVPERILENEQWYREFEGMAFDFGREMLLPRRKFEEYVRTKYKRVLH